MKKLLHFSFILVLLITNACGKNNESIDLKDTEVTLYAEEEYSIKANSDTKISYESKNEYIATVTENGIVTAVTIGETSIILNNGSDNKIFKVTVKPKYDLYPNPDLSFGSTKSSIVSKYGTPDREDENGIAYENYSYAAPIVSYRFIEDKLVSSAVIVKTSFNKDLLGFLFERYIYLGMDDEGEAFLFINNLTEESATMDIVAKEFDENYWIVGYLPISSDKSVTFGDSRQIAFKQIGEAVKKTVK